MAEFLRRRHLEPVGLALLLLCAAAVAGAQKPPDQTPAQTPSSQTPSSQTPSGQAPSGQTPSGQQSQSAETIPRQTGTPLVLNPDLPGLHRNHRLILKDGSYQIVSQYKVVGDRVQYFSTERSEWEDVPSDLVDWDATRKWEQAHRSADGGDASPGMKEAEDVDKEELAARDEAKARMPEVAPGLQLPDQDGVFVLDTYHGTPELVELASTDMSMNLKHGRGLGILNPTAGQSASVELDGAHARIHLHVNDPAIYLSLPAPDNNAPMLSGVITVNTAGGKAANNSPGAASARSAFAIIRVDERNAVRIVGAVHINSSGAVQQDGNVVPAKAELMPGKRWLRIQPAQTLTIGEYALVEILSPTDISPSVWDFRVDPTKGDNPGSLTPILAPVDSR